MPLTLFEKIWNEHVVLERHGMTLLHIDRHVLHDLSAPPPFDMLRAAGLRARNPELAIATIDHMTHAGRTVQPGDPSASSSSPKM
jgi:3-isopropylmalate/(R)-2-methylmalate dehydratase large subunit